ncbi:MAG TPA: EAL domain-containing protein [Mycobacteriales bacterium]|nr:EAL domain-containing protein [Mycobacteriales bacterium]
MSRAAGAEAVAAPRSAGAGFWWYLGSVGLLGLAVTGWSLARLPWSAIPGLGAAFFTVAVLLALAELRPLVTAGSPDENGVTISTAFVFALLLHWGLPVALLMQTVATVVADTVRRRAPWRTTFNVAQYALSWSAAAAVLAIGGVGASIGHPLLLAGRDLPIITVAALMYFLCNDLLVTKAVAQHQRLPLREIYAHHLGYRALTEGALLALSPIVVVVMERDPALVPLLILPIAAVYATASVSLQKEHQAHHDALTGLPNRKLLLRRAGDAIERSERTGEPVALFLLDLDRFKEVNDTLGHATGDALLQLVATRLSAALRPGDTVARLGGDEFAVLLPVVRGLPAAQAIADRVHRALVEPFGHQGMSFDIEGSLGIALYPAHAPDVATLMQRADVAMYLAKESGTGIEIYSADRDRHSPSRLGLSGDLRRALSSGELAMHYQPKVDMVTGAVTGVEALLRWCHPERGLLQPDDFLPLAESSGLMRRITHFAVESALDQAARWEEMGLAVPVAVNVCARDLYDGLFVDYLRGQLAGRGLAPTTVQLEVTESMLMADPGRAAVTLDALHELGVSISLDDFGTGYSSLVHLRRLPVSEIKIDRSFVGRMTGDEDDAVIVRSMIDLGAALGVRVVAEGVETAAAWRRLAEFGCPAAQGWFFSKALPADDATGWLRGESPSVISLPDDAGAAFR